MNDRKSYLLATVGIVSLVASLTLNIARANNREASTLPASTHFTLGRVYLLSPANGSGIVKCKVIEVDGTWLNCEGLNQWMNSDAMLYAVDSR